MAEAGRSERASSSFLVPLAGLAGVAVGLVILILLVDQIRTWTGLPQPEPVPLADRADKSFGPTYWVPWVTAWPVILLPGLVMALAPRTRREGYAYAIAVLIVGGLVTLLFAPFDWFGLAPT